MIGWCLYELIYILAVGNLSILFTFLIILNLFRLRWDAIKKTSSLAFVALIIFLIGVVVSEIVIELLSTSNCTALGNVSIMSMVAAVLTVSYISFAIRKRKFVFNNIIDKVLGFLFVLFVLGVILFLVLEEDFLEFLELFLFFPIRIFEIISQKF